MKYEKSKVLFVSDLDGTLLTPQAVLRDGDAELAGVMMRRHLEHVERFRSEN